jgi:hypothetical protein
MGEAASLPAVDLEFLAGASQPSRWQVNRVVTLLGRSPQCTVRLQSFTVSRFHTALLRTPGQIWMVDLLGREGTQVNGTPLRWARLDEGDEMRIGQFLFRIHARDLLGSEDRSLPPTIENGSLVSELAVRNKDRRNPSPLVALTAAPPSMTPVSSPPTIAFPHSLPAGLEGTDQSLLLPIVSQFSLMQQQMFDQFQQALTMMVQMFSGLHRDQMDLIRQELNQLHELTRELRDLQTELAKTPKPLAPAAPIPSPVPAAVVPPKPAPTPAPPPPSTPRPKLETTPSPPTPSAPVPPVAPAQPAADVHAWLSQRLATIQQERQSRWQKILNMLSGK